MQYDQSQQSRGPSDRGISSGARESLIPPEMDLTTQQRVAELIVAHLGDFERTNRLLDFQRKEIKAQLETLEKRRLEVFEKEGLINKAEKDLADANAKLHSAQEAREDATQKENNFAQRLQSEIEKSLFPECLFVADLDGWRAKLLSDSARKEGPDNNSSILLASLHLAKAAEKGTDKDELYAALYQVGRNLYKASCSPELVKQISELFNKSANNLYSIKVARAGTMPEKAWMNFSGISTVNSVQSWAIFGPDNIKRHAAEVA